MSHLQAEFLHGCMYVQRVGIVGKPGGGPPPKFVFQLMCKIHPTLRRRIKTAHDAFTSRLWLQDLADWDRMKPDSIARNTALQSPDLSQMGDEELLEHLDACYLNAKEMVYRHHKFTVGSIMPVGRFLDVATRNSGLTPMQVAPLLKGSTPVSRGVAGEELVQLASTITAAGISKADLDSKPPVEALAMLRAKSEIKLPLDAYLAITGHMLIGGYCISEKPYRSRRISSWHELLMPWHPGRKLSLMKPCKNSFGIRFPRRILRNLIFLLVMRGKLTACVMSVVFTMTYGE